MVSLRVLSLAPSYIMVNDLVSSWVPRAKYVDDLTVLEVVPRNSPSMLNFIVNEIESYAISNNMRLNPLKCKELSLIHI